ncbi:MAG TPA: hypothetical protein VIU38_03830 [Anaerolineales bacterium]
MNKRLLVVALAAACLATLTACGGGSSTDVIQPVAATAPVELELASAPASAPASANAAKMDAATAELLSPEFGCSGGGHLEYGLVNSPAQN